MNLKRKLYLDYLRVIATLSVIMIHIFITASTDFIMHTIVEDSIVLIIVQCLHFCVPIFLMISGSLFLQKEVTVKVLFKKYILRYIIVLLTFGYIMAILEEVFKDGFSFFSLLIAFKYVLIGKTWDHMWYLYMLIGLMILLPFIKIISDKIESNDNLKKYYIIISILSCFLFPMIKKIFGISFPIAIPIFSNYVFYFILGRLIDVKKIKIENKKNIFAIILICLLLSIINIFSKIFNCECLSKIGGYDSLLVLIMSVSIFSLLKNNEKNLKYNKYIAFMSKYSFGVYLIHMFWINIAYKYLKFNIFGNYLILKIFVLYLLIVILSYLSSLILKKFPVFRKIL